MVIDNLVFIGTLHQNLTPRNELIDLILSNSPQKLLVEIVERDIEQEKIKDYPPEMLIAYKWAVDLEVDVYGFDANIEVSSRGASKADFEKLAEEQHKIIGNKNWKNFNKPEFRKLLRTELWDKLIDETKWQKREQRMYENIIHNMSMNGTNVVITGSGHIPFFQHKFPDAKFPLA